MTAMLTRPAKLVRFLMIAIAAMASGLLAACETTDPGVRPQFAVLLDSDVVIRAQDGSWELREGQQWRPASNPSLVWYTPGQTNANYMQDYRARLAGKRSYDVFISAPELAKPLYGKLVFNNAAESSSETDRRVWRISVPKNYRDQGKGGVVSVVHSTSPCRPSYDDSTRRTCVTWALWMSDYPLN